MCGMVAETAVGGCGGWEDEEGMRPPASGRDPPHAETCPV